MMRVLAALALVATAVPGSSQPQANNPVVQLWRLDCGNFVMKQFGAFFSDTFQYPAGPRSIVGSCYLIRHGSNYLLWDTGLTDELVGRDFDTPGQTLSLKRSIVDQLAQIGIKPQQVGTVGISHWHFDHVGQARRFPNARLLIGRGDVDYLKANAARETQSVSALEHWLNGAGKLEPVTGDRDIFGDGRVLMISLPGHTPGHYGLLVRLASGRVLLSGDQYHFTEAVKNRGVPPFNHSRADTLASHDRFDRIAANVKAKVIIQHEPSDIAKLPAFPKAAE